LKSDFPILIAEDNPVSRRLMETTLRQADFEVVSAENGVEALKIFKKRFFPIVLTDWGMPEMDGLQLCRSIRENPAEGYVLYFPDHRKGHQERPHRRIGGGRGRLL
jgi:two-component system cell cycle response regulator